MYLTFSLSKVIVLSWVSLVAQSVKNLPAVRETWVRSLVWRGHGNPLQYSCLENSHGQSSLVGYSPQGLQRVRQDFETKCTRACAHTRAQTRAHAHTSHPLYPVLCPQTLRLFPVLAISNNCCNEHWAYMYLFFLIFLSLSLNLFCFCCYVLVF